MTDDKGKSFGQSGAAETIALARSRRINVVSMSACWGRMLQHFLGDNHSVFGMRLDSLGTTRVRLSRLNIAILFCLTVSAGGAALFALASFLRPLAYDAPEIQDWRTPTFTAVAADRPTRTDVDHETLARPLFAKSRRPYGGERDNKQDDDAAFESPAGMTLLAVAGVGENMRVFIVSSSAAEGKWLSVGETIDGWTIVEARDLQVTLRNSDRLARLQFDYGDHGRREAPAKIGTKDSSAIKRIKDIRNGAG